MRASLFLVFALALCLAACREPEARVIDGGPTMSEALSAVLSNGRIVSRNVSDADLSNVRLEASRCVHMPRGEISCQVRLYSLGRGWSAPTPGRFVPGDGGWSFVF
jgi:hypothetical protein